MLKINELPQDAEAFAVSYSHPVTRSACRVALRNFQRFAEWAGLTEPGVPLNPVWLRRESLVEFLAWMRRRYSQETIARNMSIVGQYLDRVLERQPCAEMWTVLSRKTSTRRRRARLPLPAGSKSMLAGYKGHTLRSYRGALIALQRFAEQTDRTAAGLPVKRRSLLGNSLHQFGAWLKRRGCRPATIQRHLFLAKRYLATVGDESLCDRRRLPKKVAGGIGATDGRAGRK